MVMFRFLRDKDSDLPIPLYNSDRPEFKKFESCLNSPDELSHHVSLLGECITSNLKTEEIVICILVKSSFINKVHSNERY